MGEGGELDHLRHFCIEVESGLWYRDLSYHSSARVGMLEQRLSGETVMQGDDHDPGNEPSTRRVLMFVECLFVEVGTSDCPVNCWAGRVGR